MCGGWPFGVASQSKIAGDGAIETMAYTQDEQLSHVKGLSCMLVWEAIDKANEN